MKLLEKVDEALGYPDLIVNTIGIVTPVNDLYSIGFCQILSMCLSNVKDVYLNDPECMIDSGEIHLLKKLLVTIAKERDIHIVTNDYCLKGLHCFTDDVKYFTVFEPEDNTFRLRAVNMENEDICQI
jgi:hypothetical protein